MTLASKEREKRLNEERITKQYRDAVWDYCMEHCDVTKDGHFFVKFHTNSRSQFEGHVNARIKGYHRADPRIREQQGTVAQAAWERLKEEKRQRWLANKERGRRMLKWRRLFGFLLPKK